MKKLFAGFILIPVFLAVSCDVFFSNNTGEEGNVTLSLDHEDVGTGAGEGSASFDLPDPGDGGDTFPNLGDSRLVVYNSAGKSLRSYTFPQGQGSLTFSVPAGGPYWVDFTAPVQHPDSPENDPFPFVKSFGATVKLDAVEKGSNQELFLPLRVRETAIMTPYMPLSHEGREIRTDVFAPFYDLPELYPAGPVGYVDRKGISNNGAFDVDPYGRLLTTIDSEKKIHRIERLNNGNSEVFVDSLSFASFHGLAFNLQDGDLYFVFQFWNNYYFDAKSNILGNRIDEVINQYKLSSPIITIDEAGILYGLGQSNEQMYISARQKQHYWGSESSSSVRLDPATLKELLDFNAEYDQAEILDLKALNGYLYALLYVKHEGKDNYNDYFAAIPLESIQNGTAAGSWFVGGTSVDELPEGHDRGPGSREGFFGPKKFAGWGPDRIYIYDYNGSGEQRFHRIVEVDLRNRGISKAGLIANYQ
jgi:hypothetical protein